MYERVKNKPPIKAKFKRQNLKLQLKNKNLDFILLQPLLLLF